MNAGDRIAKGAAAKPAAEPINASPAMAPTITPIRGNARVAAARLPFLAPPLIWGNGRRVRKIPATAQSRPQPFSSVEKKFRISLHLYMGKPVFRVFGYRLRQIGL